MDFANIFSSELINLVESVIAYAAVLGALTPSKMQKANAITKSVYSVVNILGANIWNAKNRD